MAKHNFTPRKSVLTETRPLDSIATMSNTQYDIPIKKVQALVGAELHYVGLTGKQYIWKGSGEIVLVDEPDVQNLLDKTMGSGCCGANVKPYHLFRILEE